MSIISDNNNLAQHAMQYAANGFKIFPITPGAKTPLLPESWPLIATDEPTQVLEWWQDCPQANIGIKAGESLVIIDVDRKKGLDGMQEVGTLIDENTLTTWTPNAGYHFYYSVDIEPGQHLRNLTGVDVQHRNHYVLAPPSTLTLSPWDDPVAYLWANKAPIAPLPEDLKNHLLRASLTVVDKEVPQLLSSPPEWPWEHLKESHLTFLNTGLLTEFPSRSEMIPSIAARLYRLTWTDEQVFSKLWQNPLIQDVCLGHRQGDAGKALVYLWSCCVAVRHNRKMTNEEAFKVEAAAGEDPEDPEPQPKEEEFKRLQDAATRLDQLGNPREILRDMARARMDPIDRDTIMAILRSKGHAKASQMALYKTYEREVQAATQSERGGGVIQWVHTSADGDRPLGTLENLQVLLDYNQTKPRHNLMSHYIDVDTPGQDFLPEERLNSQLTLIRSWAAETRMPLETVAEQLSMLATRNAYHPFREFCERQVWDGMTRLPEVLDTIQMEPGKEHLKAPIVFRWLLSVVACAYDYGNRPPRGVLTFIGAQQIGKTTWLRYLVPDGMYYQGHLLNLDDKDSATKGLRYLICELGEVGSTYKKSSIEKLKNYIGQREDKYRLPYAREESHWPRRTVFAASTNNEEILHDQTGNTRWWALPVEGFDLDTMERFWGGNGEGRDLQQLWAEMYVYYQQGYDWDLSKEETEMMGIQQQEHREITHFESQLLDTFEFEDTPPDLHYPKPMTEEQIWLQMGVKPRAGSRDRLDLRDALRYLTNQRRPILKHLYLATSDGKQVNHSKRVWFMPKSKQPVVFTPFKAPVHRLEEEEGDA